MRPTPPSPRPSLTPRNRIRALLEQAADTRIPWPSAHYHALAIRRTHVPSLAPDPVAPPGVVHVTATPTGGGDREVGAIRVRMLPTVSMGPRAVVESEERGGEVEQEEEASGPAVEEWTDRSIRELMTEEEREEGDRCVLWV